jgi:hypothetical protein
MPLFLNYFFFIFHLMWIVFNLTGWRWRETRKLHLITMLLTAFSWFILGLWHDIGYCITDHWHSQVRESLGYPAHSDSFIHFMILRVTGLDVNDEILDMVTMIVFIVLLLVTMLLNWRDRQVSALSKRMRSTNPYPPAP